MQRLSTISGHLKSGVIPTAEQIAFFRESVQNYEIPGVNFDLMEEQGIFAINRSLDPSNERVNANYAGFASRMARVIKDLAIAGLNFKGELFLMTTANLGEPAVQHLSVRNGNVVYTDAKVSMTGKSTLVHA